MLTGFRDRKVVVVGDYILDQRDGDLSIHLCNHHAAAGADGHLAWYPEWLGGGNERHNAGHQLRRRRYKL